MALFYGGGDDPGPSSGLGKRSSGIEFASSVDDGMDVRHTQLHKRRQPILPGCKVGGNGKASVYCDGRFADLMQTGYEPGMGRVTGDSCQIRLPGAIFHQQF